MLVLKVNRGLKVHKDQLDLLDKKVHWEIWDPQDPLEIKEVQEVLVLKVRQELQEKWAQLGQWDPMD